MMQKCRRTRFPQGVVERSREEPVLWIRLGRPMSGQAETVVRVRLGRLTWLEMVALRVVATRCDYDRKICDKIRDRLFVIAGIPIYESS